MSTHMIVAVKVNSPVELNYHSLAADVERHFLFLTSATVVMYASTVTYHLTTGMWSRSRRLGLETVSRWVSARYSQGRYSQGPL